MTFEVLYCVKAVWDVGANTLAVRKGEHYPDDYAGKVISVRKIGTGPSLRKMANQHLKVVELDLDEKTRIGLSDRKLKIDPLTQKTAVPTLDDRWGKITADVLRANFADPLAAEAKADDPYDVDGKRFADVASLAVGFLPKMEVV